jgi:uncharacterized hydrophobic protein (TIGR00271 family)
MKPEVEDLDKIHETIVKDSVFRGTNLWILVFAIVVASIGLNMNSTAVIIGAMLISPLMGPINAMGYSVATYNFDLFRSSVKNFTFAVFASLTASTVYFALSPVSTAHSELLARTTPTIYDVLIALFGGLAGIVATSSKQKGNVIPGVAIATALMPPLCTAGYGLATAQFNFFFGALYLFTINTVFIALASLAISQILRFPIRTILDPGRKKVVNSWISFIILLVLLPSIYFGYLLVQKEKFSENAKRYILNVSAFQGNYLLNSSTDADRKTIRLIYGGINLTEEQKSEIAAKADDFGIPDAQIIITQGLTLETFDRSNTEVMTLREEINNLNTELRLRQAQLDSISRRYDMGRIILNEIRALYPQIESCVFSDSYQFTDTIQTPSRSPMVIFGTGKKSISRSDREKIENWVQSRLRMDNIRVIYE